MEPSAHKVDDTVTGVMISQASFERLPLELFECITECLSPRSLASLRLVSRASARRSFRTYIATCFTTIDVVLSDEHSLQNALELADHPAFGKKASILNVHLDCLPRLHPDHEDWAYWFDQESYSRENFGLQHLFSLLWANRDNLTTIRMKSGAPRCWKRCCWPAGRAVGDDGRAVAHRMKPPSRTDMTNFLNIISTLGMSGAIITDLEIVAEHSSSWSLPLHEVWRLSRPGCILALSQLTSIDVSIWTYLDLGEAATAFTDAFREAPLLKHLAVAFRDDIIDDYDFLDDCDIEGLTLALMRQRLPSIKTFRLTNGVLGAHSAADFIFMNPTLEVFSVRESKIIACTCLRRGGSIAERLEVVTGFKGFQVDDRTCEN
ncbi:uncharacterized protein MYCFIDRAFT_79073 [Pseudocercospora fijiensis CIRAD86]|uniref:F-box domain-containing protein n=1 Tax=Pseudocercospora fijiensis (strain CIRAD86) TaxID=383855 RepID=M2ZFC0_PSEFD|nr:uncharacterized protein MYCFIDRAFT_79073 [Pseudocercospora fijiensis CIRAD86]EME77814.1 hypothetical protein MYCFIDRAFT_79073 [Pseudocercospora fijiensis CIRAD86]